jgi:A/G-specific adenine glycosylase
MELPGIGANTAGAVLAFAYNIPQAFIETNIRSVFIHFFFRKARRKIDDNEIMELVEKSLTNKTANPRKWFYALMDYGVYLKSTIPNPSRKSRHYARQSPFKGSNRELRAQILRNIIEKPRTVKEIIRMHGKTKQRSEQSKGASTPSIMKNIANLEKEGFITKNNINNNAKNGHFDNSFYVVQ